MVIAEKTGANAVAELGSLEGTDFRTAENYKTYLDAGLNTLFIQENDGYNGYSEASLDNLKNTMNKAKQAGIERVIIADERFTGLSRFTHALTDAPANTSEESTFKKLYNWTDWDKAHTQAQLETAIKNALKDYIYLDNFYGVMLSDEPSYANIEYYAQTYALIKKLFPVAKAELVQEGATVKINDIYIKANLLPATSTSPAIYVGEARANELASSYSDLYQRCAVAFSEYLNTYVSISGCTEIVMDSYAVSHTDKSVVNSTYPYYIQNNHFYGVSALAEVAKANGSSFGGVVISTEYLRENGNVAHPTPNEAYMRYQLNSYMIFGASSIGYHTYWAKTSGSYQHPDGTSFIGRDGKPTELYPVFQKLNGEIVKIAEFLRGYDYNGYQYVYGGALPAYYANLNNQLQSFACVTPTLVSGSDALITEFNGVNSAKGKAYAVMNTKITDFPDDDVIGGGDITVTLNVTGASGNVITVLRNGVKSAVSLTSGSVTLTIPAGQACYLIVK